MTEKEYYAYSLLDKLEQATAGDIIVLNKLIDMFVSTKTKQKQLNKAKIMRIITMENKLKNDKSKMRVKDEIKVL